MTGNDLAPNPYPDPSEPRTELQALLYLVFQNGQVAQMNRITDLKGAGDCDMDS